VLAFVASLKTFDRRALVVPALFFLYVGGIASTTTFLSIYLVREQGMSAPLVGLGLLAQNLVRAILAPFVGALSDRYGRRALLIGSAVLSAAVTPGFLFVNDVGTLMAWSIAVGIVQAPFFPVGIALLLDLTPLPRHQSMIALNTTALNVGYTLSIAPAGYLVDVGFGWLAVWSVTQFVLVFFVLVAFVRGALPRGVAENSPRLLALTLHAFRDRTFVALSLLSFTFPLSLGLLVAVLPLYATDVGVPGGTIGLLLSLNGVVVAALMLPLNLSLERFGPFRPLPVAAVIAALSELVLREGSLISFALAVVGFGVSEVIFSAALVSAIATLTPPGARGAYQGAWALVSSLGFGSALLFAGLVRTALSWETTWTIFAAGTVISAVALAIQARPMARVADARAAAVA
jgi:MFS family permease